MMMGMILFILTFNNALGKKQPNISFLNNKKQKIQCVKINSIKRLGKRFVGYELKQGNYFATLLSYSNVLSNSKTGIKVKLKQLLKSI